MAEVFSPRLSSSSPGLQPDDPMGSDVFGEPPSMPVAREPLPAFVFPMQSSRTVGEVTSSAVTPPSSAEPGSGRRHSSRSRPQHISVNACPPFDFLPSTEGTTPTTSGSSTHSPTRSLPIPSRVGGHRRGGSEFIGGDGTTAGPGLMSSSPTKGEGGLPSPPGVRRGPSGSRRGHAHRRSGAISSHDVSNIIRAPVDTGASMSGSAPNTPSDPNMNRQFLPVFDRSTSQPILPSADASPPRLSSTRRDSAPLTGQTRPRVGFSDTVEFIPRPLSTISSETSSSMSTIRASHSVTGSITSIVSGDTSSPQQIRKTQVIPEHPGENKYSMARPKSAGAMLDNFIPVGVQAERPMTFERPSANASPGAVAHEDTAWRAPRQGHLLSSKAAVDDIAAHFSGSLFRDRPIASLPAPDLNDVCRIRGEQMMLNSLPVGRPRSSPELKDSKRPRNVRSWAGSILSRKGKSRDMSDQADIPCFTQMSLGKFAPSDDFSLDDINFDEDTTCVIHNPQYAVSRSTPDNFSGFGPRVPSAMQSSDSHSLVLDLDAALYPFERPGDIEEGAGSRYPSTKRRMHSGGVTGGFAGPGMHYHRRAESAPEMAPVDYQTFGLNRLGSNSAMADVFEEDEEDDVVTRSERGQNEVQVKPQGDHLSGLGVRIMDIGSDEDTTQSRILRQDNFSPADINERQDHCVTGAACEPISSSVGILPEESVQREIVDTVEEPRFSNFTKSSTESTVTPTLPLDAFNHGQPETPTDDSFARPLHYPNSTEAQSSVSSPDFASTSFDVPRLHTATSSITDRTTLSSRRAGGIGQGSTYSAEDVPSLISSASTTISSHPPRLSTSAETRSSGERSMSFSAAVPRRTRPVSAGKRSSLASLSRLVGGSYGEKSKLSIESRAQSDDSEKPGKKKGNRISRLMRFWKPKERLVSD